MAGLGLLLVVATLAFLGRQLVAGDDSPPDVTVQVERVTKVSAGYLAQIRVRNRGGSTAAGATVEATLDAGGTTERATVTIDYVPAHSERRGGLLFRHDPRAGRLELRATGYRQP